MKGHYLIVSVRNPFKLSYILLSFDPSMNCFFCILVKLFYLNKQDFFQDVCNCVI